MLKNDGSGRCSGKKLAGSDIWRHIRTKKHEGQKYPKSDGLPWNVKPCTGNGSTFCEEAYEVQSKLMRNKAEILRIYCNFTAIQKPNCNFTAIQKTNCIFTAIQKSNCIFTAVSIFNCNFTVLNCNNLSSFKLQ